MKTATTISIGDMTTGVTLTGIGMFLALAILAITIWLEYVKDNKEQDWLERCLWGTKGDKYKGKGNLLNIIEAEQADLNQALAS